MYKLQTNVILPLLCAGKRRIRVHTLCLPVVSQLSDVFAGADVQAITCLLANMGQSHHHCPKGQRRWQMLLHFNNYVLMELVVTVCETE